MLEVDEHSPLNDVSGLRKKIGEGGRSIGVDEQARVNRWQVWIARDHSSSCSKLFSIGLSH